MADVIMPAGIGAQVALVAELRWRLYCNSLRTLGGKLDLLAKALVGTMGALVAAGIGLALAAGAHAFVAQRRPGLLALLLWAVFLCWHFLFPAMMLTRAAGFDFRKLLHFPLRFSAFFLLSLAYGLFDPGAVTSLFWLLCLAAGVALARPDLLPWALLALAVFAVMNLLLSSMIASLLERLLARRRTREALGALFLLLILCLQFSGMFLERWGRRAAPVVRHVVPALAILPPGLAGAAMADAVRGNAAAALGSTSLVACYALAFGLVLRRRLRAQYLGEDLGETQAPASPQAIPAISAASSPSLTASFLPGPVAALFEKEFRYLFRNAPMLLNMVLPILLIVALLPTWGRPRHGPGHSAFPGEMIFPAAVGYVLLLLTHLTHNSFAYDGRGIQLLFVAPVRFRDVLLGKNLAQGVIVAAETLLAWAAVSLISGPPRTMMLLATLSALLFALLLSLAVGNLLSLYFPRRLEFGQFRRQRAAGMTVLIGLAVNLVVMGLAAAVLIGTRWFGGLWMAVAIFLGLSAASWQVYRMILERCTQIAAAQREVLADQLCR